MLLREHNSRGFEIKQNEDMRSNILGNDESPLVSVIITTRNEKDIIKECITSIFEQTYPNFEVIIIDAKSSDGTFQIAIELDDMARSFKNCKRYLFRSEEANSPAKGRNIGVKDAYGTIVAFTDGDCVAEKDWLTNLVNHLPREDGIVGGPNILRHLRRSNALDAVDNVLGTYLGSGGSPQFLRIIEVSDVYAVPSCNLAIQKSLFDDVGGFDENLRYNEDSDLCRRVHNKGHKIIYNPQAKVNHFMGLDSFCRFSRFMYKYGLERGKSIARNSKLLTRFNTLSIAFILLSIFLIILSFFTTLAQAVLLSTISVVILIPIFFSVKIAMSNRSPIIGILTLPIYVTIFVLYNTGLLFGYICQIRQS